MTNALLANEATLRLAVFAGLFAVLAVSQRVRPRRRVASSTGRMVTNLSLVVIDTLVLRLAFPLLAFDLALQLEDRHYGLNAVPAWLGVPLAIVLLDFSIYWQHRLMHVVPWLWRLHRAHHADTGFDVTTAVRFHPVEIAVSMGIKLALIALLGAPAVAVLLFEVLLNASSLFNHANLDLGRLDGALRRLIVTPDMHRIHHSVHEDETRHNFGFALSIWDRLFGSYRDAPRDGHTDMTIGLPAFRDARAQSLLGILLNPLAREPR
ncbi:MAG: sterol desaturase family protein [Pseudomonadota bacterium]